jgi:FtsP/CotA-like multicopper oxidase with cupredoxin domain
MFLLSRRQLLASASAASLMGAGAIARSSAATAAPSAESPSTVLRVVDRSIEVNRKSAKVYGLIQPNGMLGIMTSADRFRVRLENHSGESTLIHWHGLLPPYGQDGVPDLPQPLLPGGHSYDYDFPLNTPGTHWMHAHTLQEQQLLAAPLIVTSAAEMARDEQQVVVLLHDFSFKSPEELLVGVRGSSGMGEMSGRGTMADKGTMPAMPGHDMPGMSGGAAADVNDIDYDAYLANDRTLDDPEVFRVELGGMVRLRLINGATATAFWIDLGELSGDVIAVDGNPIVPQHGRRFPLAMGQRIDIRIRLPKREGAWPIVALREGAVERTGFVLATRAGVVRRIASSGKQPTAPLDLVFESGLRAAHRLAEKSADRHDNIVLGGDMAAYVWTLNGRAWGQHLPLRVRADQRIEVTLRNDSMMGHPMHLHGHHFQVVAIAGQRIAGAIRDTVWLPPKREITVAFDAYNPGVWPLHCHHLYHMAAGMMTAVAYET